MKMQIHYEDEYGTELFIVDKGDKTDIPLPNDNIVINDEQWTVKGRTFHPKEDLVIILVTQDSLNKKKIKTEDTHNTDNINYLKSTINSLTERLTKQESRSKMLTEELITIRTHIRRMK